MRLIKLSIFILTTLMVYACAFFVKGLIIDPAYPADLELVILAFSLVANTVAGFIYINRLYQTKDYARKFNKLMFGSGTTSVLGMTRTIRTHAIIVAFGFGYLSMFVTTVVMFIITGVLHFEGSFFIFGFFANLKLALLYLDKKCERAEKMI